ncbi:hypothetical protein QFW77_13900 [Luteimonas sp. RD2P54]|uniref:Nucleotide modification associated domain-containing protein n=1 Tax=Luteimonas endophytica TaxID=3042023 RepID=A0ABT6JB66_9GAMM|nr:hypothetical protein [Luteimonas endophytica]MDH5824072.1 hypothetical protein [Luteimonas endophytica]
MRRLILSRKGFDAGYGGMPSPILPDGRLLPLPIPGRHDAFTLADAVGAGEDHARLLAELSRGRITLATQVHLDPDLARPPGRRLPGWRPALGQAGGAQSHLRTQGVGAGDVFLFFGWFREVENGPCGWRFVPRAPDLHVLFGWLEVGAVLPVVLRREACLARYPWIADHPHVANPEHYASPSNTLYVARARSRLAPRRAGGGVFPRYRPELRLTAEGESRSIWTLPSWFHPAPGRAALSYHGRPSRWRITGAGCRLHSVPKGQEFVMDVGGCESEAETWLRNLVAGAC